MVKWTKEQNEAVISGSNNILVSASAGSGKTTTMIARIIQILEIGNSTLEQLLVLTFTEESAKDMRKKLKQGLGSKLSQTELQSASIGTFHGFCANLIRAWFSVAEVSPSFSVMPDIESEKIKIEIFDKIIEENYANAKTAVDLFASTRTLDGLREVVLALSTFLETRISPENWIKDTALKCYSTDVNSNLAIRALMEHYKQAAAWYRTKFIDFNYKSDQVDFVMDLANQILQCKTYEDFYKLTSLPKFPTLKKDKDFIGYEEFHTLRSNFRDDVIYKLSEQFSTDIGQVKADIESDKKIVEELVSLVEKFSVAYAARKLELKKLDFADLEKYTLKILRNEDAVGSIRAKYKYIFVDEGQDTNPVQFEIVKTLCGDDKFFYMVGDVKQSIYGFRGCEPDMFENMTTQDLIEVLRFNKNFRSNNKILRFVNSVFSPLMLDYSENHKFIIEDTADINDAVKIELANSIDGQMELICRQIKQYCSKFGDIAVLSESTTHFQKLKKFLTARGIPCVVDRATDACEEYEIVVLNNFLFSALNPTNLLPKFLTMKNIFGYTNDDLAKVKLGQKSCDIDSVLAKYNALARTLSTYEVISMAAAEFGLLDSPVVDSFLTAIRGVSDFDTVARYLYLIEHKLVKIEINPGANIENAVRIMTIHHSKGLEFPMVVLFNMGDSWSRQDKKKQISIDKNMGICVLSVDTENYVKKSGVLRLGVEKKRQQTTLQEKIRLLYVALTRAKDYLYITGIWKDDKNRQTHKSMLDLINPTYEETQEDVLLSDVIEQVGEQETNEIEIATVADNNILVKQSVTALASSYNDFADYIPPVKFNDEGGKEFGTAFHKKVQWGELPDTIKSLVDGCEIYKEFPFLYLQDQTIVQGIIDLLAVKGKDAIIVDYKTTRATEQVLVEKYKEQLRLYANAIQGYNVKTYIFSTVHEKLIAVLL